MSLWKILMHPTDLVTQKHVGMFTKALDDRSAESDVWDEVTGYRVSIFSYL